jgi:hypothetical protein
MEQLISKGEMFKLAFTLRYKKQTMIDLRGISKNWLKTSYVPPQGFLGYGLRLQSQKSGLTKSTHHLEELLGASKWGTGKR